jgi:hypothetical protein
LVHLQQIKGRIPVSKELSFNKNEELLTRPDGTAANVLDLYLTSLSFLAP